ncbi:SIR2 family protein [Candidatus Pacearchaeota archaeon]|nr:SIR2 family protein [Candidatus Pacearchaeota archaeon]
MAETIGRVAHLAQKYTEDVPVIVLGTGATIPLGLPSMGELADYLIRVLVPDTADKINWQAFKADLQSTNDLELSLHNMELSETLVKQVLELTWRLLNERDLKLYKDVLTHTIELPIVELLTYFLRTANPRISIITTNYDRMAEYAADLANASAYTGFTSGYLQAFAASTTRPHSKIDIWKVHGSLDWFIGPDGQIIKTQLNSILPNFMPLIVTPGLSKYRITHGDPFRTVLTNSDTALNEAKCYLCIGYGFNDEHVQPILIRRVQNDKIPLVVVTKKLTEKARELMSKGHFQKYLFIEEDAAGAKIFSNEFVDGISVSNDLWKLEEFAKLIIS